jgi:hypothetical protein
LLQPVGAVLPAAEIGECVAEEDLRACAAFGGGRAADAEVRDGDGDFEIVGEGVFRIKEFARLGRADLRYFSEPSWP